MFLYSDRSSPKLYVGLIFYPFTLYYLFKYINRLGSKLVITDERIEWGNRTKPTIVNWASIQSLTINYFPYSSYWEPFKLNRLVKFPAGFEWTYEFTLKGRPSYLHGSIKLDSAEYDIMHDELILIFKEKSEQYGYEIVEIYQDD